MNRALLSDFTSLPWAMEPSSLEAFLLKVSSLNVLEAAVPAQASQRKSRMTSEGDVATIPISGVLMKTVPAWMRFLGIDATGYDEIRQDVEAAVANPDVEEIRLKVASPGGQVAGVKEAADAIFSARKTHTLTAEIEDMGASGAYWLASQAGRISAGPNSMVGSIGVYTAFMDLSRMAENEGIKVHVVASGPHKGMGVPGAPITAEQLSAMQDVISGMASNFVDDVARGLKADRSSVEKWATGRVWLAAEAKSLGLIASVTPPKAAAAHVGTAAKIKAPIEEETGMAENQKPAAAAPEVPAVPQRKIATPGELRAAFPKDPEFAMVQLEAGATLTEAKAAYGEVLEKRLEASQKEVSELRKKPAAVAKGAEPLTSEGEPGDQATQADFLGRAQKLAEEKGWPVRRALSHLARTEPQLYESYMREIGAGDIVDRRVKADGGKRR